MIVLSAWRPTTITASTSQPCVGLDSGSFEEIVYEYNQFTRSKSAVGALMVDTISLYNNFCEASKNEFANNWLGMLSKGADSYCIHIK